MDRTPIEAALGYARKYGQIDGDHHKAWVIDQMVRALLGCEMQTFDALDYQGKHYTFESQEESPAYLKWVAECKDGEDGPETYSWSVGIAP